MGHVTLHPGRIVVSRWPDEDETVWPAAVEELLPYFFHWLEIDPDFTLGDLFALVDRDDAVLLAAVLNENVIPLLEEARRGVSDSDDQTAMEFLRVHNRHEDGYLLRGLDAWGTWSDPHGGADGRPEPRATWFSVSLTPVGEILDLRIRYDPGLEFRGRDRETEYRTNIAITLLDFFKAVFDDLTFYGTPEERNTVREELRWRADEVRRGEARLIPAEDVLRRLRRDAEAT